MGAVDIWPLLGVDSFVACMVLSTYKMSWRERCAVAAAFGFWDGTATSLSPLLVAAPAGLITLAIYLVCALLLVCGARSSRMSMLGWPIWLSIDNLFGGAAPAGGLVCGLSSAALAFLGLQAGAAVRAMSLHNQGRFS